MDFILFVIEILCANRHSHILSVYRVNPVSFYKKADCEKSFCTGTHTVISMALQAAGMEKQ